MIFLHGAGESQRGPNESYACLRHGVPKIILAYDKLMSGGEPAIDIPRPSRLRDRGPERGDNHSRASADLSKTPVPAAVCRAVAEEFVTLTPVLDLTNGYGWNDPVLTSLLDGVLPGLRVDPARVHATGFSMGGYGTWSLGLHTPDRFASLAPVCGGGDVLRAGQLAHVPQWVHHGELDDIIPVSESSKMVSALKKVGADVRFSRYPGLAHDSWTEAYNNIEFWEWMLENQQDWEGVSKVLPDDDKVDTIEDINGSVTVI